MTVEKGGFGAETAAPAARLILRSGSVSDDREFHAGTERDAMSASPIQPASEPPPPLVPREWRLRLDPLLLLATLGLVACSLIAIKGATARRHRRRPALLRQAPGASTRSSGSS